jgi:porphobilinogen synthase
MQYPLVRPRRLRRNAAIRGLVRETRISLEQLIYPLFIVPGEGIKREISSLPGLYQFSIDTLMTEIEELDSLGIKSLMLFGVPEYKDSEGSSAWDKNGIIQKASRAIKELNSTLQIIADVCFCEYTDHGHCGVLCRKDDLTDVDNDKTLVNLSKQALSLADAGIDIMAPSGNIDGMVGAIRFSLDENSYSHIPIMSYAVKYHSAFYGPFREAVDSSPSFGDRQTYQMDPANALEALRESTLDLDEGADFLIVKPALSYLDIICRVKDISPVPLAAYNVSGEYAMLKIAARHGLIDEKKAVWEMLTSIKRAGADIIITYFAKDIAKELA